MLNAFTHHITSTYAIFFFYFTFREYCSCLLKAIIYIANLYIACPPTAEYRCVASNHTLYCLCNCTHTHIRSSKILCIKTVEIVFFTSQTRQTQINYENLTIMKFNWIFVVRKASSSFYLHINIFDEQCNTSV